MRVVIGLNFIFVNKMIIKYLISLLFLAVGMYAQHSKLKINHLSNNVYIYTTYKLFSGSPFPSNSMYIVTDDGVVLIDTPWDEAQFEPLLDSIKSRHNKDVVLCIATHYHDDRTAGLEFLRKRGIAIYSSKQTYDLCAKHKEKQAEHYFTKDTLFTVGGYQVATFYPGEGHTKDNIVIWLPKHEILYGGCLVKSLKANGLGNTADANLEAWDDTIKRLIKKYLQIRYIVPGHFDWSQGKRALLHTLKLLQEHQED